MRNRIKLFVLIVVIGVSNTLNAQSRHKPKSLKFKKSYNHKPSKTLFPNMIHELKLIEVLAFDKKRKDIGLNYKGKNADLTLYIYPAGNGSEGRLRNEYWSSLQEIVYVSSRDGIDFNQDVDMINRGNGNIKFIKARFDLAPNKRSIFFISECGSWFIKYRLTQREDSELHSDTLERTILNIFHPEKLISSYPLNIESDINFAPAAFRDSIMLGSVMGSAFKKLEWANQNIKNSERESGFPDLYLEMHIEAIKQFLEFEKRVNYTMTETTREFLDQVRILVDSGFLKEFLMKHYNMLLVTPEDAEFDFEAYETWLKNQNLNLLENFDGYYVITNEQK